MKINARKSGCFAKSEAKGKTAYILGISGQNIIYGIITTGLTFYYQSVIFLPALFISVLTVCVKIFDIIKDPFIGAFMDKHTYKSGKYIPYLKIIPIILGLLTVLLFVNKIYGNTNTNGENAAISVWTCISYFLWSVAYSFGDIPLNSLPPLITDIEKERNSLIAVSRISATIGVGLISVFLIPSASFLGNFIYLKTGNQNISMQYGFLISVSALTFIGVLLFQLISIFVKERTKSVNPRQNILSPGQSFKAMRSCKPYRRLMISCLLRSPTLTFSVVQITMFVYYFGNNGSGSYVAYMIAFSLSMFLGQGVSMLFTPKLTQKIKKRKLMIAANIGQGISFLMILILYYIFPHSLHSIAHFALLSAVSLFIGFFSGIINVLIPIMIADSLDIFEKTDGFRPDGAFFSGMTMINKLSYGVGAVIVGIVFAVIGFSADGVQAVNDALYNGANFRIDSEFGIYRTAIFSMASVPPFIGSFLSIIPLKKERNRTGSQNVRAGVRKIN